jgi:hypothetical protein
MENASKKDMSGVSFKMKKESVPNVQLDSTWKMDNAKKEYCTVPHT